MHTLCDFDFDFFFLLITSGKNMRRKIDGFGYFEVHDLLCFDLV